jgi:hypothetical protein
MHGGAIASGGFNIQPIYHAFQQVLEDSGAVRFELCLFYRYVISAILIVWTSYLFAAYCYPAIQPPTFTSCHRKRNLLITHRRSRHPQMSRIRQEG